MQDNVATLQAHGGATGDSKVGQGDVIIQLSDRQLVLKPTVYAMQHISRTCNGLQNCAQSIMNLDFAVICLVVEAGLGLRQLTPKRKEELAELLWSTGLTDDTGRVAEMCLKYVGSLMRGGKPAPEKGSDDEEAANEIAGKKDPLSSSVS